MATVIGQSGAWHSVVLDVGRLGHTISRPEDIEPLAARLREQRPSALAARRAETMLSVQALSAEVAQLNDRGILVRFLNRHKVTRLRHQIDGRYADDRAFGTRLDRVIGHIESIPGSAELVGAQAELEVVERLRLLPEQYFVFNDVLLHANRTIRFDDAYLQSAQLDHAVLGPTGVFTIETKCWSRATAESGSHHNPFDQAKRAGYLCYDLLKQGYGPAKVHSVIACLGSLPAPPPKTMIHVLRPADLRSFISEYAHGKEELSSARIEQLRRFFETRVATRAEV